MDIVEFFETCAGKWFSQRTSHDLKTQQATVGKSDLWMEAIAPDDPAAKALRDRYGLGNAPAIGALKIRWEGFTASPDKQTGSALLVALAPDGDGGGPLLNDADRSGAAPGRYAIDADGAVTFVVPSAAGTFRERIWFANPNLRLRTSVLETEAGATAATFCSEIRMGGAPPAQA